MRWRSRQRIGPPRAMAGADLADQRLDALAQAEPAVVRAVVAGIGEPAGAPDADQQGEAQQFGEHPGIVDIGGRGHGAERQPVARDHDMILGAGLAPVGPVRSARRRAWPERSNCRRSRPGRGRPSRDRTGPCAAWTRGSTAASRHSASRRRRVEPEARPSRAGSSRHWTPSRRKNRKVSTTSAAGRRGRPRSAGSPSSRSMIPATSPLIVTTNSYSYTDR